MLLRRVSPFQRIRTPNGYVGTVGPVKVAATPTSRRRRAAPAAPTACLPTKVDLGRVRFVEPGAELRLALAGVLGCPPRRHAVLAQPPLDGRPHRLGLLARDRQGEPFGLPYRRLELIPAPHRH